MHGNIGSYNLYSIRSRYSEKNILFNSPMVWCWFVIQYFSNIMAVCFVGGGNWSTRRKPLCVWKTLIYNVVLSTPHLSGTWTHNASGNRQWFNISNQYIGIYLTVKKLKLYMDDHHSFHLIRRCTNLFCNVQQTNIWILILHSVLYWLFTIL
jgi:hypothetical protein